LTPTQRQYEALRGLLLEGLPATVVAERFGYQPATVRSLCRDFRQQRLTFLSDSEARTETGTEE